MAADAIDDTTTDAALIVAPLDDAEVFATVYDRHATALYRYARRRLGSRPRMTRSATRCSRQQVRAMIPDQDLYDETESAR